MCFGGVVRDVSFKRDKRDHGRFYIEIEWGKGMKFRVDTVEEAEHWADVIRSAVTYWKVRSCHCWSAWFGGCEVRWVRLLWLTVRGLCCRCSRNRLAPARCCAVVSAIGACITPAPLDPCRVARGCGFG